MSSAPIVAGPRKLLALSEIIQCISPVGIAECIFSAEAFTGASRTGFCHTTIPNTVVLAMSTGWLAKAMESPHVACVFTTPSVFSAGRIGDSPPKVVITIENAAESFYFLHNQALHEQVEEPPANCSPSVAPDAMIASSAILDGPVIVESGAVIGHQVILQGPVRIGRNTRIDAQCAIGVEGLFTKPVNGRPTHIRHYGGVEIGANSHLCAGCNVACSVNYLERTWIGDSVSLGPRTVVGHDSHINDETTISTQAAVMGRAMVGARCWVGAGALISNSVKIGEGANVRIGAVVLRNVPAEGDVSGNFAVSHSARLNEYIRNKQTRQV